MIPISATDWAICLNFAERLMASGTALRGSNADIGSVVIARSKPIFTGAAISASRYADPFGEWTWQRKQCLGTQQRHEMLVGEQPA